MKINVLIFATLLLTFAGCGGDGVTRAPVQGEVKVDGAPLESGTIDFFPSGGTVGPSATAEIVNGRYELGEEKGPVIGRNRVEIRGYKKTGKKIRNLLAPNGLADELVEALPPDANEQSTLQAEIVKGANTVDFTELKGVGKRR